MTITVGRIVHYVPAEGYPCYAAIVASVGTDGVPNLWIFYADFLPPRIEGQVIPAFFRGGVPYSDSPKAEHWHWPEREE